MGMHSDYTVYKDINSKHSDYKIHWRMRETS